MIQLTEIESYLSAHKQSFLDDLIAWLRIPSISALPEHSRDVIQAANYAVQQLKQIGMERTELIQTQGYPFVYSEWLQASGQPTLLIYGHYDVQPVDPLSHWQMPPFEPTIRDGKIFARGAADYVKGALFPLQHSLIVSCAFPL
jgi:acetylornithine deacetylase/succinyl-diaminopimelate desuccinylase-like protein